MLVDLEFVEGSIFNQIRVLSILVGLLECCLLHWVEILRRGVLEQGLLFLLATESFLTLWQLLSTE